MTSAALVAHLAQVSLLLSGCTEHLWTLRHLGNKVNAPDLLHKGLSHASNFIHQHHYACSAAYNPEVSSSLLPGVTSHSLEMFHEVQIICWMEPLCWPVAHTWLFPLTFFCTAHAEKAQSLNSIKKFTPEVWSFNRIMKSVKMHSEI